MLEDRSGPSKRQLREELRHRHSFLRAILFLDAGMRLCPNLTLRLLNRTEPELAQLMAKEYGYTVPGRR